MPATAALPQSDPWPGARPRVLLAGASGLVGRAMLAQLLDDDEATVHALLRRDVPDLPASRQLKRHVIDFANPGRAPPADELYIALGTTIKAAGSEAAFRAVDFDAVVNVARSARDAGVELAAVVSALGASARSALLYNRVKGEMEQALRELRFDRLVIARPSLLAGDRAALQQAPRRGERWSLRLLEPVSAWLPGSIRPIEAAVVARAMRLALRSEDPALAVLESGALQRLGSQ